MHIDWQGDSALCAWIDGQQVAMLDISKCANGVTVNMLFVKPPFRRRGTKPGWAPWRARRRGW